MLTVLATFIKMIQAALSSIICIIFLKQKTKILTLNTKDKL